MPISLELSARLHNTATRDEAMLEVAYEYIFALGVDIAEISGLLIDMPFLNERRQEETVGIIDRVLTVNSLAPRAREAYTYIAGTLGAPETIKQQTDIQTAMKICHYTLMGVQAIAPAFDMPEREAVAAFARIGVQTASHFILNGCEAEKPYAKAHLVFFTAIETLALGTLTDAYQYCHVNPQDASKESFWSLNYIRPIIQIHKGDDEKHFLTQVVFGDLPVEHRVIMGGETFYYVRNSDKSADSDDKDIDPPKLL